MSFTRVRVGRSTWRRLEMSVVALAMISGASRLFAWTPKEIPGLSYPVQARQARIEGTAIVDCTINEDGTVREVNIKQAHPVFAKAVLDYAKSWRFARSTDGHDEPAFELTIEFRLVESDCGILADHDCCKETFLLKYPDRVVVTSEMVLSMASR